MVEVANDKYDKGKWQVEILTWVKYKNFSQVSLVADVNRWVIDIMTSVRIKLIMLVTWVKVESMTLSHYNSGKQA